MKRLSRLILIFAILFAAFILLPPFLSGQFGPYPLMKTQDIFDLFTPLVLIPAYWLLFQVDRDKTPSRNEMIAFLVLAALWVEGQGMHLAANSIDNLVEGKGPQLVVESVGRLADALAGSGVAALTFFYDEVLSHYLWHAATMALAALLILRQWRNPSSEASAGLGIEISAGVLHGLNYGLMVLEGETAPLGVPFAALVVIFTLVWGRGKLRQQPILTFFFVAFAVASLLFLAWWLAWGCLTSPLYALRQVLQGLRPVCP